MNKNKTLTTKPIKLNKQCPNKKKTTNHKSKTHFEDERTNDNRTCKQNNHSKIINKRTNNSEKENKTTKKVTCILA